MTFLKLRNVVVNNFSLLVTGYRRQVTECHATALHKLGIYCERRVNVALNRTVVADSG